MDSHNLKTWLRVHNFINGTYPLTQAMCLITLNGKLADAIQNNKRTEVISLIGELHITSLIMQMQVRAENEEVSLGLSPEPSDPISNMLRVQSNTVRFINEATSPRISRIDVAIYKVKLNVLYERIAAHYGSSLSDCIENTFNLMQSAITGIMYKGNYIKQNYSQYQSIVAEVIASN